MDYRLLLFETTADGLVAVAAHMRSAKFEADGHPTYFMVLALATSAQGKDVPVEVPTIDGPSKRLSCYVFARVVADALGRPDRNGVVWALVDPDNIASRTVCGRMGMAFDGMYRGYMRLRAVYR